MGKSKSLHNEGFKRLDDQVEGETLIDHLVDDDSLKLERAVDTRSWYVPAMVELDMDGDRLLWRRWEGKNQDNVVHPGPGLLEDFIRLGESQAEDILNYARRWGVLLLCEHDWPAIHSHISRFPYLSFTRVPQSNTVCYPRGYEGGTGNLCWEPLQPWRRFSRRARAILAIANQLYKNELGSEKDWWDLMGREGPMPEKDDSGPSLDEIVKEDRGWTDEQFLSHKREDEKIKLTNSVREWLSLASLHLDFDWYEEVARFKLTTSGLFGALAMQIALAVSRRSGLGLCSHCGKVEMVERQPRADKNFYCKECRTNQASKRQAYKRYDQTRRKKRKKNSHIGPSE